MCAHVFDKSESWRRPSLRLICWAAVTSDRAGEPEKEELFAFHAQCRRPLEWTINVASCRNANLHNTLISFNLGWWGNNAPSLLLHIYPPFTRRSLSCCSEFGTQVLTIILHITTNTHKHTTTIAYSLIIKRWRSQIELLNSEKEEETLVK